MRIVVQIQLKRAPARKAAPILSRLKDIVGIVSSKGRGFVNVDFKKKHWLELKNEVESNSVLASCSIITSEGTCGWNDYLLLHSFDKSEKLDAFKRTPKTQRLKT